MINKVDTVNEQVLAISKQASQNLYMTFNE